MVAAGAPVDLLHGCNLPAAWADQRQWRILEIGFGRGLNFLAAWLAWKNDPQRPLMLHFVSIDAVSVLPLPQQPHRLMHTGATSELVPLLAELASQCFGLSPGFHRLVFEGGRVLLTLCIGDVRKLLREQDFAADSIFLRSIDPVPDATTWDLHALKALARLCRRGTRLAAQSTTLPARAELAQCGFVDAAAAAISPQSDRAGLQAVFAPAWEPKGMRHIAPANAGRCVVVGAGLAGAAAAASLARRGWQVQVLDSAPAPAAGASAVPAGLLCPDHSPDDNLLSRLSRSGVRATLQQARALLREGTDWQLTGALEHRVSVHGADPEGSTDPVRMWSRSADPAHRQLALLNDTAVARWHPHAAWIKPAALVRAWLAQPGISWRGGIRVARIERQSQGWTLLDAAGRAVAQADLVVIAAAQESAALLATASTAAALTLQPVRGQLSWAVRQAGQRLPPFPVNGLGYFIADVPLAGGSAWLCGSTFVRGDTGLDGRHADHEENLGRLQHLLPATARQLASTFATSALQAWTGIRCASADRRPLVGELEPGLWLSTAMGSRGLTFAALCAELIAARLHDEPLLLPRKLAAALDVGRRSGRR